MPGSPHLGPHPAARLTQPDGSPLVVRPDRVDAVRTTPRGSVLLVGGAELPVRGTLDEVLAQLCSPAAPDPDGPVAALGLSSRAVLALDGIGVRTVRDLVGRTESEVARAHNCGPRTLTEIRTALAAHGLALRDAG